MKQVSDEKKMTKEEEDYTLDGTVDRHGQPAIRSKTGTWVSGILLLGKLFSMLLSLFQFSPLTLFCVFQNTRKFSCENDMTSHIYLLKLYPLLNLISRLNFL